MRLADSFLGADVPEPSPFLRFLLNSVLDHCLFFFGNTPPPAYDSIVLFFFYSGPFRFLFLKGFLPVSEKLKPSLP